MTRKWKNRSAMMSSIKLFLIDEIHVLGESNRGATIEAVVSRMKTIAAKTNVNNNEQCKNLRFVAISATIPNIEDVCLIKLKFDTRISIVSIK